MTADLNEEEKSRGCEIKEPFVFFMFAYVEIHKCVSGTFKI